MWVEYFARHAYVVLFAWVFIEQVGLPIPSVPVLLAAGTLTLQGHLSLASVLICVVAACLIADSAWFLLGKRYGRRSLEILCKLSLLSSTKLLSTHERIHKHGRAALLIAKFVPGFGTLVPPIAASSGMPLRTFLLADTAGSLVWACTWIFGGRVIGGVLSQTRMFLNMQPKSFIIGLLCLMLVLILWRVVRFMRFAATVRRLRLEPDQLQDLIAKATNERRTAPFIIDLRQPEDFRSNPFRLPNAFRLTPKAFRKSENDIPRDRDVVLYCSCPSQATSTLWAMRLNRLGVQRVRLLHGGWEAWSGAGYALEPRDDLLFLEN